MLLNFSPLLAIQFKCFYESVVLLARPPAHLQWHVMRLGPLTILRLLLRLQSTCGHLTFLICAHGATIGAEVHLCWFFAQHILLLLNISAFRCLLRLCYHGKSRGCSCSSIVTGKWVLGGQRCSGAVAVRLVQVSIIVIVTHLLVLLRQRSRLGSRWHIVVDGIVGSTRGGNLTNAIAAAKEWLLWIGAVAILFTTYNDAVVLLEVHSCTHLLVVIVT